MHEGRIGATCGGRNMTCLGADVAVVRVEPEVVSRCHACALPRAGHQNTHLMPSQSSGMQRSCYRNGPPIPVQPQSLGWRSMADGTHCLCRRRGGAPDGRSQSVHVWLP
eukprot:803491-Amphidinium_carterae.1